MVSTRTERKVPLVEKVYDDCTKRFTEIRTSRFLPREVVRINWNSEFDTILKLAADAS